MDKDAWANAVFDRPVKNPDKVSEEELHAATDMMLFQYHRIIMESVKIIRNTKNADTRQGRIDLCQKNYEKMKRLEPFADEEQRKRILDCEQALKGIVL